MDNQNQPQFGSSTISQPSWMIAPPEEPKKAGFSKLLIAIIAIVVVGGVAVACAIFLSDKTVGTGDEPISDADIETTEYIVNNVDLVKAFINAANNGGTITQLQCKKMVSYGNKYASTYKLKNVSDNFCNNQTINVGLTYEEGKSYPNEPMTVILLQANDACLKFPFYDSLYSMQDYEVLAKCPINTTVVEVQ